jgi:hypothetical protein
MTRKRIHSVLILDQSGSMSNLRSAAVQFYNESVQQAQINAKDQDIFCSLLTFNGEVWEHLWDMPAEQLQQSTDEDYHCLGNTALNDALGYTIEKLLTGADSEDPNTSFLIQVVTDGEENHSKVYPASNPIKLRTLVSRVQETGRWTISFLGCAADYLQRLSASTNVPIGNMAAWNNRRGTRGAVMGLRAAAASAGQHYQNVAEGFSATNKLHSESEKTAARFSDESSADLQGKLNWLQEQTGGALISPTTGLPAEAPKANVFGNQKKAEWSNLPSADTSLVS